MTESMAYFEAASQEDRLRGLPVTKGNIFTCPLNAGRIIGNSNVQFLELFLIYVIG